MKKLIIIASVSCMAHFFQGLAMEKSKQVSDGIITLAGLYLQNPEEARKIMAQLPTNARIGISQKLLSGELFHWLTSLIAVTGELQIGELAGYPTALQKCIRMEHPQSGERMYCWINQEDQGYEADICQNETILFKLGGHTDSIEDATFNHDASLIATGSKDKTVKIWDAHTGVLLLTLHGHEKPVFQVTFEGTLLKTESRDIVNIWNVHAIINRLNCLKNLTLDQTILLYCIYEVEVLNRLLKEKDPLAETVLFNLEKHKTAFSSLPEPLKKALGKLV